MLQVFRRHFLQRGERTGHLPVRVERAGVAGYVGDGVLDARGQLLSGLGLADRRKGFQLHGRFAIATQPGQQRGQRGFVPRRSGITLAFIVVGVRAGPVVRECLFQFFLMLLRRRATAFGQARGEALQIGEAHRVAVVGAGLAQGFQLRQHLTHRVARSVPARRRWRRRAARW